MLPPVHVALSSSADYQSNVQPAAMRAPIRAAVNSGEQETADTALSSGGRQDALSLSAQLKLAQGSSILAETIGRLLEMPRKENETLVDYTTRLFEAVQALKPSEQAAIERLLNQIVKGISLRLMAEILKDPSGPDAARLAGYIEAASTAESDLAAKAVVSSYRQNGSTEAPVNSNIPRPVPGGAAQSQPGLSTPPAIATAAAAIEDAAAKTALTPALPEEQADLDRANAERRPAVDGQATSSNRMGSVAQATVAIAMPPASIKAAEIMPPAGSGAAHAGDAADAHDAATASTASEAGKTKTPPSPSERGATGSRTDANAGRLYDGPALARRSLEVFRQEAQQAPRAAANPAIADAAAVLATALAETGLTEQAHLQARARALPFTAVNEGAEQPDMRQDTDGNAAAASGRNAAATEEDPTRFRSPEAARTVAAAAQPAAAPEQPDGLVPGILPVIPREGVPLPQVPYPPGEQEPHREERKTRELSAIGDEEDESPQQGHDFHHEQQEEPHEESEEGKPGEETRSDGGDEDGRPNDLYWRMAGWS